MVDKGDRKMISEIHLNQTPIKVYSFKEEERDGLHKISVSFKVTSEAYHDIATLLYHEVFDVYVPERKLHFKGRITNYHTSITNLYQRGQVGDYHVTFMEIKKEKGKK